MIAARWMIGCLVSIAIGAFLVATPAQAQTATGAGTPPCRDWSPRPGEARKVSPCGNPQSWIDPERDFSDMPAWKSASGQTAFRLDVDERGSITRCTIIASNVDAALNARLCQMLSERGRFRPAIDAAARPFASSFSSRINWWGGHRVRVPLESWARTARVEFNGEQLARCDINGEGGASGAQVYMCHDPYSGSSELYEARQQPRIFVRRIEYLVVGQTLTTAGDRPLGEPFAKTVMAVEISAKGEVRDCTMLAEEGAPIYPRRCGLELEYLPLPRGMRAPAKLVRIETIWELPVGTP